jgi:hypothetical protein
MDTSSAPEYSIGKSSNIQMPIQYAKGYIVLRQKTFNSEKETSENQEPGNTTETKKHDIVAYINPYGVVEVQDQSKLNKLIVQVDNRTDTPEEAYPYKQELEKIKSELLRVVSEADLSDEYLQTQFRIQIRKWIEKYQIFSMYVLMNVYKVNKLLPSILTEIAEQLGIADLQDQYQDERIGLLNYFFDNGTLEVKHGVIDGISNLNPQVALPILEESLKKESSKVLKHIIASYIEQLRSLAT